MRERVCRRGHHVREGENGKVRADGYLVCYDCQNLRYAARHPDAPGRHPESVANPWAGRVVCPDCDSSDWTMPYDPTLPTSSWRCVACHCWAYGPMRGSRDA